MHVERELLDVLPEASAELVLIRVFVSAYLATTHLRPHRRARAFLDEASRILKNEQTVIDFVPGYRVSAYAQAAAARQGAIGIFNELLPALAETMPPEDI